MKILVLSSHTQSLFWFRLDMMQAFINKGAEVIAVGNEAETEWENQFRQYGITYLSIPVSRNGLNFFSDLKTFKALKKIIDRQRPEKIFVYQAKTIVYGSLAAHFVDKSIDIYPLVAGLGSVFRGKGLRNCLIKNILSIQYKIAFKYSRTVIFQNNDDREMLVQLSLVKKEQTDIINGSGVNTDFFSTAPLPSKKAILYIGRLIADKGIREYLQVCKRLKEKDDSIECLLVGPYDTNPSAITPQELQPYIDNRIIRYYGEQKDVRPYLRQCYVYVLPSYHEGTPKTVLEAMSIGRPIVTTDAPGCRETVIDGKNGFLVPVREIDTLEEAVLSILTDKTLASGMAAESRKIAESKYDIRKINNKIINIMNL